MCPVFSASGIKKSFGGKPAVDNVSIEAKKGEILGLLGPNGAGKTTLARILVGLEKPDAGSMEFFGSKDSSSSKKIRKLIALVPQEPSFYYSFSVRENIEFFASLYGGNRKARQAIVIALMEWLDLSQFSQIKARNLSGGYKRLLNIACSLVNDPALIFMDEPTVGLDPKMRQLLWNKISELSANGKTIVLTTHYMDEAEELCDRVALMRNGKIVVVDSPKRLISKYGGKTVLILNLDKNVELDLIVRIKRHFPKSVIRSVKSSLVIPTEQSEVIEMMATLSSVMKEAGYRIIGSDIKEPQLEDVFMHLTQNIVELAGIKNQVIKAGEEKQA